MKLVGLLLHEAVGLCEGEVVCGRPVDEDTTQPGGVVAAGVVVFAVLTRVERGVHEEVGYGVGLHGNDVAEGTVDGPGVETLGNLLVSRRVVAVLVEVAVAPGHITLFVDLAEGVLGEGIREKVKG